MISSRANQALLKMGQEHMPTGFAGRETSYNSGPLFEKEDEGIHIYKYQNEYPEMGNHDSSKPEIWIWV